MSGAGRSAASARVGVGGMPSGDVGTGRARELGRARTIGPGHVWSRAKAEAAAGPGRARVGGLAGSWGFGSWAGCAGS